MKKYQKAGWLAFCASPLLIAATLSGDTTQTDTGTRLSVTGQGYSSGSKEILTISAGSKTFSESPSGAVSENAAVLNQLRKALSSQGVLKRDITTGRYSFGPGRKRSERGRDMIEGYDVSQSLTIFVRDTGKAGQVLDLLVKAGATNISVSHGHGWSYGYGRSSDALDEKVQATARKDAVSDAQTKARDYAEALGMRVKRVISIRDNGVRLTGGAAPVARAVSMDVGTQIDTGEQAVVASVAVEFELEPIRTQR